jgi:hypothetical protein
MGRYGNRHSAEAELRPQSAATVVQPDPVGKRRSGKPIGFDDVVQEPDHLVGPGSDLFQVVGLLDRIEIVASMVNSTARGCRDVVEPGEIAHEKGFGGSAIAVEPAVCHWPAAACLGTGTNDIMAEAFEQFASCYADLGQEGVDLAGDEESDTHAGVL